MVSTRGLSQRPRKRPAAKSRRRDSAADELLAGYRSFVDLPRWRRRLGPLAAVPGLGRIARPLIRALAPGLAREMPKPLGILEYAHTWAGTYLLRRGLFLP
jgi:asparagine synthase (glutamine-hydrolysing)